ncbi:hypothetical protein FKR81_24890 [Lentzea tibetensis]|uniref:Uncharacterized protein n=1 Tax=Lentzea tibetensis TaxID=2591470 RepID=A0A563EPT1_9PSEU|nr:hypothetical protein [Lentzea tibetensis]TWP49345.1 hypothetical protein FKR81_24890 [Lentzea tibetensis]
MSKRTVLAGVLLAAVGLGAGGLAIAEQAASADSPGSARAAEHRPGPRGPGKGHPGKFAEGVTLVVGTVKSVENGKLVVTKDGGGEATITTDGSTRFRGGELSGLKQGQRVAVRVKDGKALGVAVPKSHASGTVTSVDGDKAVLIKTDGLQVNLDLSGVSEKPKSGDLVVVTGTVSDGKTIKVEKVRQLPK